MLGVDWAPAVVVGGAVAMSSTAIVLQQLTDQAELNRTHGRLSFAVLLFQDLAFVPLLALATALVRGGGAFTGLNLARLVVEGLLALFVVLAIGRWLLRPLFYEIAHSRLRELFTLTVLLVVLSCAWVTAQVGLSMALGAFLAGMMLAETEYRHQVESAVRPFRELLLGLFFISVGMLLDLRLLYTQFLLVTGRAGAAAGRQEPADRAGDARLRRQHLQGGAHRHRAGWRRRVRRGAAHAAGAARRTAARAHQPAVAGWRWC